MLRLGATLAQRIISLPAPSAAYASDDQVGASRSVHVDGGQGVEWSGSTATSSRLAWADAAELGWPMPGVIQVRRERLHPETCWRAVMDA